ncbi:hypothetical protein K438DRAFT_2019417 [Mycena galopus ATCC 62051]|nr:hypothetical protein K438DRAFT_2019417 [Mycena galopus ATCC 62051]
MSVAEKWIAPMVGRLRRTVSMIQVRIIDAGAEEENTDLRRLENDPDEREEDIPRDDQRYAFKPGSKAITISGVFAALLRSCRGFTLAGRTRRPHKNGSGAIVAEAQGARCSTNNDDKESASGTSQDGRVGGPAILESRGDDRGRAVVDRHFLPSLASKGERKNNAQRRRQVPVIFLLLLVLTADDDVSTLAPHLFCVDESSSHCADRPLGLRTHFAGIVDRLLLQIFSPDLVGIPSSSSASSPTEYKSVSTAIHTVFSHPSAFSIHGVVPCDTSQAPAHDADVALRLHRLPPHRDSVQQLTALTAAHQCLLAREARFQQLALSSSSTGARSRISNATQTTLDVLSTCHRAHRLNHLPASRLQRAGLRANPRPPEHRKRDVTDDTTICMQLDSRLRACRVAPRTGGRLVRGGGLLCGESGMVGMVGTRSRSGGIRIFNIAFFADLAVSFISFWMICNISPPPGVGVGTNYHDDSCSVFAGPPIWTVCLDKGEGEGTEKIVQQYTVNSGRGFVARGIPDSDDEFVLCQTTMYAAKSSPTEGNFAHVLTIVPFSH